MQNTKTTSAIVALFFIMSSNNLTASGKLPHTPAPYASSASNVSTPSGRTHVDNSAQEESEHTVGSIRTMGQWIVDTVFLVAEKASDFIFGQRNNEVEQSGDTYNGDTNSNNTNSGTVNIGTMSGGTGNVINNYGGTGNVVNNHGGDTHYNYNNYNNNYYIYCDSAVAADVMAAMRTAETERDYKKQNISNDDSCYDGYATEEMESGTPTTPTLEMESDYKKQDVSGDESCHDGYATEEMKSSTPATPTLEVESDDKKYNLCEDKDFCPLIWQ